VDGTLIEAWASQKSFQRKDGGESGPDAGGDFRGQKRSNETHESEDGFGSASIPEVQRSGIEAELSGTHGGGEPQRPDRGGHGNAGRWPAEREAAALMIGKVRGKRRGRITLGADKAYDTRDFVGNMRRLGVTPHVMQNTTNRRSAIDGRTTRHAGYLVSLSKRWLVEKPFGWLKQTAGLRKVKLRGLKKVRWLFVFTCAAYNLLRIPKLRAQCV